MRPNLKFRYPIAFIVGIGFGGLASSPVAPAEDVSRIWSQWRGGDQNGFAGNQPLPTVWGESQRADGQKGIRWKLQLPGRGGSTPVISGSTAYLTAGVGSNVEEEIFGDNTLVAIDTPSGKIKWQAKIGRDRSGKHKKGSGSNPSAVDRRAIRVRILSQRRSCLCRQARRNLVAHESAKKISARIPCGGTWEHRLC